MRCLMASKMENLLQTILSVNANFMIRKALYNDIEAMIGLLEQLFAIEDDFTADSKRQSRGLQLGLDLENVSFLVAEIDNKIVGMVSGQLLLSSTEGGVSLLVEDLVVDSSYRGQGIGRKLLHAVGVWGSERGADRMQLLTDCDNLGALDFYLSQGWRRTKLICLRSYLSDRYQS